MNELFPIYTKLAELQTLVVGAGPIGLEKLQALLSNSPQAKVKVVAAAATAAFRSYVAPYKTVLFEERLFEDSDIQGVDLIILATNDNVLNTHIRNLARAQHVLINVADKPALCDFYLGSVVQKGNLKIGISTNGKSPTIAKRLKEFLQDLLPEEIDETLALMQTMRASLKGDFQAKVKALNAHTKDILTQGITDYGSADKK